MGIEDVINGGPPLDEATMRIVESKLGVALPAEYRAFLLRYNGGKPRPAYFRRDRELDTFHIATPQFYEFTSLWRDIDNMREDLPAEVIPVAFSESGDRVCIALAGENRGRVYLWDSDGCEPAFDYGTLIPGLFGDDYEFKPDDWPGHPDLTLVAENFTEFIDSFHELPDDFFADLTDDESDVAAPADDD
jgi:hypothetical protein